MSGADFSQFPQWLPVILLGSGILFAIVVMVDCGSTGQDPVIWGILVLIFNLPAFIIYFAVARLEISPTRKHKAISRTEDLAIRAKYTSKGDPDERATMGTMASKFGGIPESRGTPGFVDETLEKFLTEGKVGEARQYYEDLIAVAKEMNDRETVRNLRKYELKIKEAQMRIPK